MKTDSGHVNVLFYVDNGDGNANVESVWAVPVPEGYKIDNIPFYAKEVACNDVVSAEPDEDGALWYTQHDPAVVCRRIERRAGA